MSAGTLSATQRRDYVASLELAEVSPELAALTGTKLLRVAEPPSTKNSANVDAGSTVSFTANVSSVHRSDALNGLLLAQLNSNKLFNRFDSKQVMAWYGNYINVLGKIGWTIQDFSFQKYVASGSTFSINSAIAGIVAAFLTGPEVVVVNATLEALNKLGDDSPWYKVWDTSTHDAGGGNFQVAAAADDAGAFNTLVLKVSAYAFNTTKTTTRFLWADYANSDTQLNHAEQIATLDEDVYKIVRQAVVDKLGKNAQTYIADLDI